MLLSFLRFEYDRKMSELSCADEDHPLKPVESPPLAPKTDPDASLEGIYSNYIFFHFMYNSTYTFRPRYKSAK